MLQVVTAEGILKGTTAFFCFLGASDGRALISKYWDELLSLGVIDRASMLQVVTAEGPLKVMTPFFCLLNRPEGVAFISKHWKGLLSLGVINRETMLQVVTAAGAFNVKGKTPFFCLAAVPEGQQLIKDHWDDLVSLGLLSHESIHHVVSEEGPFKGMTPFFCFANTLSGRQFITEHWDIFVTDLDKLRLHKSMSLLIDNEGEFQGKKLIYVLDSMSRERKPLMTDVERREMTSAPVAGASATLGTFGLFPPGSAPVAPGFALTPEKPLP
jgi:hypothetical protein